MKNSALFLILPLFLASFQGKCQDFGSSGPCHKNVNDPTYNNQSPSSRNIVNATVKILFPLGDCTATLVNRNTSDGNLGFYLLTAEHCLEGENLNVSHKIAFNYQSPTSGNLSTPISNRGIDDGQSTFLNDNGYQYFHESKLRKVASYTWGDIALLEILTPVPPHFNVSFAGWNPNPALNGLSDGGVPPVFFFSKFTAVHHPEGDIKKLGGANSILWLENPVATGCYTITKVIDILFGWIWQRKTSTQTICNYIDNPWFVVSSYQYGVVEQGSSGSSLFTIDNRSIGVLGGLIATCSAPAVENYGKLHANYYKKPIKNALNPSHSLFVDMNGMVDRKITVYNNLVLPGAPGVSGHYFPAGHYQPENKIVLKAVNNITTTQPITIYNGADYEFVAGNSIMLGPGFTIQPGARFLANVTTVNPPGSRIAGEDEMEVALLNKMRSIDLPKKLEFDLYKYSQAGNLGRIEVGRLFPNPAEGVVSLEITTYEAGTDVEVEVIDLNGRSFMKRNYVVNQSQKVDINTQDLARGTYLVRTRSNGNFSTQKLIRN